MRASRWRGGAVDTTVGTQLFLTAAASLHGVDLDPDAGADPLMHGEKWTSIRLLH